MDPVNFDHREGGRIASFLDFKSKSETKEFLSLKCGLQIVADDDDVLIERSECDDDDVLIERSKCDDDDVLLESSKYDDGVANVADRNIRI